MFLSTGIMTNIGMVHAINVLSLFRDSVVPQYQVVPTAVFSSAGRDGVGCGELILHWTPPVQSPWTAGNCVGRNIADWKMLRVYSTSIVSYN